ncbi:unnamed protein product [Calypogeia fissa]
MGILTVSLLCLGRRFVIWDGDAASLVCVYTSLLRSAPNDWPSSKELTPARGARMPSHRTHCTRAHRSDPRQYVF